MYLHAYLLLVHLLGPDGCADIYPVLIRSFVLLLLSSESFLCSLNTDRLSDVCLATISHSLWVVFWFLSKVCHRVLVLTV